MKLTAIKNHKRKLKLEHIDLLNLLSKEELVLSIYPFVEKTICKKWSDLLENSESLERYSNATDVSLNRIGMTLFETECDEDKVNLYLDLASKTFELVENILGPGQNPIHYFHNVLNEVWPKGCLIESLEGRKMNPGIIRSFEADINGGLPPHVDMLAKDLPNSNAFNNMKAQLAVNLYLGIPDYGGELEIWDFEPTYEEIKSLYTGNYDFIDRKQLPGEPICIKPKAGELILFRSSCVHAVTGSSGGMRTAASCFIGFYGEDQPLTVWA